MEYYSHVFFNENNEVEKRKPLEIHLNEVYNFSMNYLPNVFLNNMEKIGYTAKEVGAVIEIFSFCHDFGKFNSKFQEFINSNPDQKKEFKDKKLKEHSLISATFGLFIATKILNEENEKSIFLKSLIFYLIKSHHSNLKNFEDEMHYIENVDLLIKQLKLIDTDCYTFYSKKFGILNIKNEFEKFIKNIPNKNYFVSDEFDKIETKLVENNKNFTIYLIINTFFSLLHDADVHSAAGISYKRTILTDFDFVRKHIKKISENSKEINKERSEIFWKLDKKSTEIDLSKRIYQITSPTGSGKTFSSLNLALQLKKRLKEYKDEFDYKIVYSIPFTSIIDQTFKNFSILLKDNDIFPDHLLLRHHHLTDMGKEIYKNEMCETETYISPELNSIIVESWDFDLIITTFIQLFESILTNNKEMNKKVHNLYNSIIIIDECQNIPVKYWDVLKEFLNNFCLFFDSYLIFLTATQPLIFEKENKDSPLELLDEHSKYFSNKDRTELIPILEEKELDGFYESIKNIILEKNYLNILIVLNTIKDSQDIFKRIAKDDSFKHYEKIYLSASLIPQTKIENIELINKLNKNKERYIAVSTQLIEAGVDIDNEVIFRDFAPFENIIQTAGRCNREGERKIGKVYLFCISQNGKQRASTIYNPYLLSVTAKILKLHPQNNISESKYLQMFEEYIKEKRDSSNMTIGLKDSILKLKYYNHNKEVEPISSFEIITQTQNKISCFINLDEKSQDVLSKYNEIKQINDFRIKTKKWLPYKNQFQMYAVDIPEKIIQSKVDEYFAKNQKKPKLIILDSGEWENYYDKTIGYIDSNDSWFI